jgi:hypothetical protein
VILVAQRIALKPTDSAPLAAANPRAPSIALHFLPPVAPRSAIEQARW